MATYNKVSGTSQTLGAGTADTVTLSRAADRIVISNTAATNPIYFTTASPGATPVAATVGGDATHVVMPNSQVVWPPVGRGYFGAVSLISAGAQTYTVDS